MIPENWKALSTPALEDLIIKQEQVANEMKASMTTWAIFFASLMPWLKVCVLIQVMRDEVWKREFWSSRGRPGL